MRNISTFLMLFGLAGMIWAGFDYFNDHRSVQMGNMEMVVAGKDIPLQGVIGAGLFIAGMVVRFSSRRSYR